MEIAVARMARGTLSRIFLSTPDNGVLTESVFMSPVQDAYPAEKAAKCGLQAPSEIRDYTPGPGMIQRKADACPGGR